MLIVIFFGFYQKDKLSEPGSLQTKQSSITYRAALRSTVG
jgi:hypothetical protein